MSVSPSRGAFSASTRTYAHVVFAVGALAAPVPALSQSQSNPLEIVVTPNRGPTSIQRSGSSISVVTAEEIAKSGAGGVIDALRAVPGLSITNNGGPAAVSYIRMRGATPNGTLVLIDGVRMNDPSVTAGEFDFGNLSPTDIERIEVLRGPQSALYGSDAMGGVINIITRRGAGPTRYSLSVGGGSYGTFETRAAMSGSTGPWNYAASVTGFRTSGFSSYGYRLPRLAGMGPFDKDSATKAGGSLRLGYRPNADFSVDASLSHNWTFAKFDSSFGDDPYNKGTSRVTTGQVTARLATLDGRLDHKLSVFAARTERYYSFSAFFTPRGTARDFYGSRYGAEYQGDLKLGAFGTLTFGTRYEAERLESFTEQLGRGTGPRTQTAGQGMATLSAFALHQFQIGERLDISVAGRIDSVDRSKTFPTGRVTASYRILETGTKFRASFGTGAKAPTLYQLFSEYGKPTLSPETSIGYDAGIEQSLWNGRVKLNVGVFENKFRNLIAFGFAGANCTPAQALLGGCYFNVGRAQTRGIEAGLTAELIEGKATLRASYTFLDTQDRATGLRLLRNPMHSGFVALDLKPTEKLTISPSVHLASARIDNDFGPPPTFAFLRVRLAPYARVDLAATYKLNDNLSLYARAENLNGARIETVRNYGSAGRAIYGGINATW